MPALLFEIGCEELPAKALDETQLQIPELCRVHLAGGQPSDLYLSPRRIGFFVPDVPERTPDEWVKGPPESMRDKAAPGFAKRYGVSVDELTLRDGFLGVEVPGKDIRAVLPAALAEIVRGLQFSKSMRWPGASFRFARPVRWLCAKLDDESIAVELDGIPSGGFSYGHRFTHDELVEIPHARAYRDTLLAVEVDPDRAHRYMDITAGLDKLGSWSDPGLVLDEVVYLVEKPDVLEGRFDEKFLTLPERVVVTTMQSHQRYFPLGGNRFAVVANGGDPAVTILGYERVLTARLEDASFTFERDVQIGMDGLAQRLATITFFAGGGTYADKAQRLVELVEKLGGDEAGREAARLAKADLASELVREFTDLQGYIGAQYARLAGYPEEVFAAIEEHYLPESAQGLLPQSEPGKLVAAADRIDTLNVAFELGHKPTGSRDPYGLRRAAIGLCRLATEGGLTIPIALLRDDVAEFVEERFEGLLDVPVEYVRAARSARLENLDDVPRIARLLHSIDPAQLARIHNVFTRAQNIVSKAEEELPEVDSALFSDDSEREVARALAALEVDDREAVVAAVEQLAEPLERFFQDVHVLADDPKVRANRLRLLRDVRDAVQAKLGDLSQIPV